MKAVKSTAVATKAKPAAPHPKPKQTAVAKPAAAAVAVSDDDEFAEVAGLGLENVTAADLLVPRLNIIQSTSPQVKKNKPEYIPEARPGMICDLGVGQVFSEGILFIPVYYDTKFIQWAPRDSGRGLQKIHTDPAIMKQTVRNETTKQYMLPNGDNIVETRNFYGFNLTADCRRCYIPFASTQIKKAQRWMNNITMEKITLSNGTRRPAPLFYRAWLLTTGEESNAQGDWYGWKFEIGDRMSELGELLGVDDWRQFKQEAIDFHDSLASASATADLSGYDAGDIAVGEDADDGAM